MTIGSVIDRLPQLQRLWQLDAGAVHELYEAGAHIDDEVVHRHRRAVTPDSIATIIYTSGTTGRPKGCVITHANFMFEADTVIERWEPVFHSKPGDEAATLLFLPLAHVFGRMVEVAAIRGRVKLGHQPQLNGGRAAARPRRVPADVLPGRAVHLREGLQRGPPQGRGGGQGRARSRRPSRSP